MTPDKELLVFTAGAGLFFGAIALFSETYLKSSRRFRRFRLPPPALIRVFRIWFGALSLGAFYLVLFGRHGLHPLTGSH